MKRIIIFVLSVFLTFGMVGCGGGSDVNNGLTVKTVTDFESVKEIMSVKITAKESKIALNTDEKYITSGKGSLKMLFNKSIGDIGYYEDNIVQFITQQEYFTLSADFGQVVGFAADVWNENDYEIQTCLSLNNRATVVGYKTLASGKNALEFTFDGRDVYAVSNEIISTVDLSFYSGKGNDLLYMDNVRLIYTDKKYIPYDFESRFAEEVNYTFDDGAQVQAMLDLGGYDSIFSRARISVNYDKRFVKIGEGSLKVEFFNSPKTGKADNYRLRTFDSLTGSFESYAGKNYALKTDVFNPLDKDVTVELKVFSVTDDQTFATTVNVKANSWSGEELQLKIEDIKNAFTNDNRANVLTVVFGIYGVESGDVVYIDNLRFGEAA